MRHRKKGKVFDRKIGPRRALMAGLVRSFLMHDRMKTTLAKAKAAQPLIERCVSRARTPTLAHRRWLIAQLRGDHDVVKKLIDAAAPRYATRPGGYTRITRVSARKGDGAVMGLIEWVE